MCPSHLCHTVVSAHDESDVVTTPIHARTADYTQCNMMSLTW